MRIWTKEFIWLNAIGATQGCLASLRKRGHQQHGQGACSEPSLPVEDPFRQPGPLRRTLPENVPAKVFQPFQPPFTVSWFRRFLQARLKNMCVKLFQRSIKSQKVRLWAFQRKLVYSKRQKACVKSKSETSCERIEESKNVQLACTKTPFFSIRLRTVWFGILLDLSGGINPFWLAHGCRRRDVSCLQCNSSSKIELFLERSRWKPVLW